MWVLTCLSQKHLISDVQMDGIFFALSKNHETSYYSFLGLFSTLQHSLNQLFCVCSFQTGDLVLLWFDERYENYLVLTTGQTLFFLHPDSMTGLDIATSE